MTDSSNGNHNLVHPERLKDPVSPPEQETIINSLKNIDPITYHYYFNFFLGKTKEGTICYFPESYRKGYKDFLDGRKLLIELELFAIGQSTGGDWVFLPSYFQGVDAARNELKFALLAEGQRRLFDETSKAGQEVLKQSQSLGEIVNENTRNKDALTTLQTGYENLRAENQNLKKMVESQKKFVDDYKKETDELKGQLQEVRTMLQGANAQQIKSSSTAMRSNNNRGERRKGAAPIS
ncbi:MAG: hypothetical protein WBX01_15715 [Nitrososphaeraceae archaeon]